MAHFSRLQITLHWCTALTGIAYAAIEVTGVGAKRLQRLPVYSKTCALYEHGRSGLGADVYGYILNTNTRIGHYASPPHWQHVAARVMLYRALSHFSRLTAAGRRDDGVRREKLELFGFTVPGIFDAR